MTNAQKVDAIKELAKGLPYSALEDAVQVLWDEVEKTPEFIADLTVAFNDKSIARVLVDPNLN